MRTSLREIQLVQLEILVAFRNVCAKYGLPYFLAQGSLLGAVRHGGFIPWDDDIDVIMPSWAIKVLAHHFAEEMGENYFFENMHTEEYFPLPWTKIRKKGTTSMPLQYRDMPVHWGICIDIFPLYEVKDGWLAHAGARLAFKFAKKFLGANYTLYEEKPGLINRLVLAIPIKARRFAAGCLLKKLESENKQGKFCFTLCKNSHFLLREWFYGEEKMLEFEGEWFRVPSDAHAFLTKMFGDYMTLPPPELQGGHDLQMGQIIWDTQKDYTAYQKESP